MRRVATTLSIAVLLLATLVLLPTPVRAVFPIVAATNTSTQAAISTSHTVSLPSGIVSGNLLIVLFGYAVTTNVITWPAGFTNLFCVEQTTGATEGYCARYRQADGTEGASIVLTSSVATRSSHVSYRITGHENPATQPPQATTAIGLSSNADPPSLTPTGGAKDYLWLATGSSSHDGTYTAFSASYVSGIQASTGTASAAHTITGSAERGLNAATENPGPVTHDQAASAEWVAATFAVHPAAAPPLPGPPHDSAPIVALACGNGVSNTVGTSHTLCLPSNIAGDLLFVAFCTENTPMGSLISPAGWTLFFDFSTPGARTRAYHKVSNGAEVVPIHSTSSFASASWQVLRIVGQRSPTFIEGLGAATTDPPALDPVGWGTEPTLWLAWACIRQSAGPNAPFFTSSPPSYTTIRTDSGSVGFEKSTRSAQRRVNVSSENPGPFIVSPPPPDFAMSATFGIRAQLVPPVVTLPADTITFSSARLRGRLDILFGSSASVGFEFGTTLALGSFAPNQTVSSTGNYAVVVSLPSNTTFFFRAISIEVPSGYDAEGLILSFTTPPPPVTLQVFIDSAFVFGFLSLLILVLIGAAWVRRRRGP